MTVENLVKYNKTIKCGSVNESVTVTLGKTDLSQIKIILKLKEILK